MKRSLINNPNGIYACELYHEGNESVREGEGFFHQPDVKKRNKVKIKS
jgi:hypothetical protein